jgi:hypothetical protein
MPSISLSTPQRVRRAHQVQSHATDIKRAPQLRHGHGWKSKNLVCLFFRAMNANLLLWFPLSFTFVFVSGDQSTKWDIGHYAKQLWPIERGFESSLHLSCYGFTDYQVRMRETEEATNP